MKRLQYCLKRAMAVVIVLLILPVLGGASDTSGSPYDGLVMFGVMTNVLTVKEDWNDSQTDWTMREKYDMHPITTHIEDASGRKALFQATRLVSSTMEELQEYTPEGSNSACVYVNPGVYTFSFSDDSGMANEITLTYLAHSEISFVRGLSNGEHVVCGVEDAPFNFYQISSGRDDRHDDSYQFDVSQYAEDDDTFLYGVKLNMWMRDKTIRVEHAGNGLILKGASACDVVAKQGYDIFDKNSIPLGTTNLGYANIFIDYYTGEITFLTYRDVAEDSWYYDAVYAMKGDGLMNGTSDKDFSPDESLSRAMLVTMLHRMEGTPAAGSANFVDVISGSYYANAVSWAQENGIVRGTSDTMFSPDQNISREQIATILMRYVDYKNETLDANSGLVAGGFADFSSVSGYAKGAVDWAVSVGLISGKDADTLAPKGNATRAEAATLLQRLMNQI